MHVLLIKYPHLILEVVHIHLVTLHQLHKIAQLTQDYNLMDYVDQMIALKIKRMFSSIRISSVKLNYKEHVFRANQEQLLLCQTQITPMLELTA